MPEDGSSAPNPNILSRELYNLIVGGATLPVLLFLIWLSWFLINRYMNPARRQERRNQEIRKAVADREARRMQATDQKGPPENS